MTTQMLAARSGTITREIQTVAQREDLPVQFILEELARGRLVIPANIHHNNLKAMAVGIGTRVKVNANIGNSPIASDIDSESKKLQTAIQFGSDTVMDLSTGRDIDATRLTL